MDKFSEEKSDYAYFIIRLLVSQLISYSDSLVSQLVSYLVN